MNTTGGKQEKMVRKCYKKRMPF